MEARGIKAAAERLGANEGGREEEKSGSGLASPRRARFCGRNIDPAKLLSTARLEPASRGVGTKFKRAGVRAMELEFVLVKPVTSQYIRRIKEFIHMFVLDKLKFVKAAERGCSA